MGAPASEIELPAGRPRPRWRCAGPAGTLGSVALVGLVASALLLGATAAHGPSSYVPSGAHRFPAWLAGPLRPFGFTSAHWALEGLVLAICVCYAAALACVRSLPARSIWAAVIVATLACTLAPPLLSSDVLGYIGFGRLGALHGLSPYSFTANAMGHDAVYPYLGWRAVTTPYGPLFTLLSYALVPLGLAGGLWALKLIAAAATLMTVVILASAARRLGGSPTWSVAMYGLNPVVLVFAVGGAHNDALFGALLAAAALWLISGRESIAAVSVITAVAIKASAALMLPFALIGARRRRAFLIWAVAAAAVVAVAALAIFGTHLTGLWRALAGEQRHVAKHSVPAELSMLIGVGHVAGRGAGTHFLLPVGIRIGFATAFCAALIGTLWRAWRGAAWLDCYAWAALALLACSAWLLPWYAMWALLPASLSSDRRVSAGALIASAYCLAIKIL